jgi:hypothetical protein
MDFRLRKLPKEAAINLRICPIASVKPYALMLAPVYVYMKANEKFVSVKAPLDFFTPADLDRLKTFESFFMPDFVDSALPFRQTARSVRSLISWVPVADGKSQLPPAPYEISDATLRLIGPLWAAGAVIEPFFVAVFVNELCDLLPEELLHIARDRDVDEYERAILRSSWAVFLALHLGYCDLTFLNTIRLRVFKSSITGVMKATAGHLSEVDELVAFAWDTLGDNAAALVPGDIFAESPSRAAMKLTARLQRIRTESMIREQDPVPTIYGERGFADV